MNYLHISDLFHTIMYEILYSMRNLYMLYSVFLVHLTNLKLFYIDLQYLNLCCHILFYKNIIFSYLKSCIFYSNFLFDNFCLKESAVFFFTHYLYTVLHNLFFKKQWKLLIFSWKAPNNVTDPIIFAQFFFIFKQLSQARCTCVQYLKILYFKVIK